MLYSARSLERLAVSAKALRERRNLTQTQAADLAHVSRQWVIALENSQKQGLQLGTLFQYLDALDCSLMLRDDMEDDQS